jgi:hypothetical protein
VKAFGIAPVNFFVHGSEIVAASAVERFGSLVSSCSRAGCAES